jgi:predicted negative regulator of RcsB-dependent stress response
MKKIWTWLKKNWKWVVFPIGVISAILGWFLWWRSRPKDDVDSTTTDAAADQAVKDTVEAQEEKDKALEQLEEKHGEKLAAMTEEQQAEFKKVKEKPIDEVASWIDNL